MFTDKAQAVVDLAKDFAFSRGSAALDPASLTAAAVNQAESCVLLSEAVGCATERLREICPAEPRPIPCPGRLDVADSLRGILLSARELAEEIPDSVHPGLIDLRHLIAAVAMDRECAEILGSNALTRPAAAKFLLSWYERDGRIPRLDDLSERLRKLREELTAKVFGQDHAIQAFIEGLFNAEVTAAADTARKSPRALFVFAGPPGVGKTFLAELGAAALERPFKRFDMSAYAGHHQHEALVGTAKSFRDAHPGTLTEFVEKNPNAVLLFDEIEKANLNAIHLFLQLLDAGTLEDKYHERNVAFRDTLIIFTTNAGRKLYERPNSSGAPGANAFIHRRTILDALEHEIDPKTREPFFPAAICSRLATGYPVLFNHLGVNELERVARAELMRTAGLFERQYFKRITFEELVPLCLVMREGAQVDARTLRAQTEIFVKTEIFNTCRLFKTDRLEEILERVDRIEFSVEMKPVESDAEVCSLFFPTERPRVLMVADPALTALYEDHVSGVEWRTAYSTEDALQILAREDVDLVLADIRLGRNPGGTFATMRHFDHAPLAARSLEQGQELLRKLHERMPHVPVYLLSQHSSDRQSAAGSVDDELLAACVRAGGVRGVLVSAFVDSLVEGWREHRDQFATSLHFAIRKLHREKAAAALGQERKALAFDTAPRIEPEERSIDIRLRNIRLSRAVAAADAGAVLDDIERPRVQFDEVIGADIAKEELRFFVDFLKDPRRFAALGLKPPKGVLLHGPPGTGKTMLARAMAGESNVAFIAASASSFVTMWQGSGPQNMRDLFERARRYAPAIIFIDEIDAVGKVRTGGSNARAEENTLNALLTEMDGFSGPSSMRPVFVLAATNFSINAEDDSPGRSARTLDPALVRRFSRTILVDLPDRAARLLYLSMRLEDRPGCSVSRELLERIAERSSGMSIANLESLLETASRNAVRSGGKLTGELLEEAFETTQFGEARPRKAEEKLRTARHEAGHAVLYWLAGYWPSYMTIVSRGDHGGYMAPAAEEAEQGGFTVGQLRAKIRVLLAGRAAEQLYYGNVEGISTGPSNDLERATSLARQMICRYGMDEDFGLLSAPELLQYEGAMSSPLLLKVNEAAGRILKEEMQRTQELLATYRTCLESIVDALMREERLTREELKQILPDRHEKPLTAQPGSPTHAD